MKFLLRFCATVLLTVFLLVVVGCQNDKVIEAKDENIETMEAVLQHTFNGPTEEYLEEIEKEDDFASFNKYLEGLYEPDFTDRNAYEEFVNYYGATLMNEALRYDYTLTVTNIDYEQTGSEEIIYNFSLDLQYQKNGANESEQGTVTGQANLNADHKIEDMVLQLEDFWSKLEE